MIGFALYLQLTFILQERYLGHGNSFHGAGGRGNKKAQMRYCLRLIRAMVSNELVAQDMCDQGIISQILSTILCKFYWFNFELE